MTASQFFARMPFTYNNINTTKQLLTVCCGAGPLMAIDPRIAPNVAVSP